jgi:3-hydroxy-9,10-secoandrosta-1,3,5(10)-triene-9,17-dione monooxygenase
MSTRNEAGTNNGPAPDGAELVARARAMIPLLRERAASQAAARRVAADTIDALRRADLFRVLQPRRWGGYEMAPDIFAEIQMTLAEGDMSTAWVYGVLGVHNFQMALFDDRAAQDVWGADSSVLIASTFQPGGKATRVEGGYLFNGRWRFSSGIDHTDWVYLGGTYQDEFLTCLLPRADYEVIDTWDVLGLKATGSQDIAVSNVFIPEYRVHRTSDGFKCDSPGNAVNTAALYRMPFTQVFIRAITSSCIGALQGMLDTFRGYAAQRVGSVGGATALDPDAQAACAETLATIDELKCVLHRNFAALAAYAQRGEVPPLEERLRYKFQAAAVPERCLQLASRLFKSTGGSGIFAVQPFGRIYSDLITARQHAAAQYQMTARNWGAALLGGENVEWYL